MKNLKNPNFIKLAESYEIPAARVVERHELHKNIQTALDHNGPYLLEIVVKKEENVFPMIPAGSGVDEIRLA